jgi:protein AIR1/2
MAEIIDLTVSPRPEIIEISSDQEDASPGRHNRTQENKKRRKRKKANGLATASDGSSGIGNFTQHSRAHSSEIGNKHSDLNESTPQPASSSTIDEPGLFIFDGTAAPIAVEDISPTPEPAESNGDGNKLLLPSHVAIFHDDGPVPVEVIPPPVPSSDDEEYIEYLDYDDRKVSSVVFVISYTP